MRPDIRPPADREAAACRALLPEAFPESGWPAELLAVSGPGGIIGAAAIAWVPRGFPVLVRVAEAWRGRGIGRALLAAAIDKARGETPALRTWHPVSEGSAASRLFASAGFQTGRRLLVFETDAAAFEAAMRALLARLSPRIPESARVVPVREAEPERVAQLAAAPFGAAPHEIARRLVPGAASGFDPDLSLALLNADVPCGVMLATRSGSRLAVEINVVAPDARRRWANCMLLEAMARRGRAAGIELFRFCCEEHVTDTINLARRSGARPLPAELAMVKPLG
ncbi:MAG: GNAT family N-acetyltransferase [Alphaproteobacteria bacterium]